MNNRRSTLLGILVLVLGGCASPPPPPKPEPAERVEPDLPLAEDTRERTARLLRLEQACDQWHQAFARQEYARMESIEGLLRTYTLDHFDKIVSDMKHGSPRFKKTAAAALGFSGRPDAAGPLLQELQNEGQLFDVTVNALLSIYQLADGNLKLAKDVEPLAIDPEVLVPFLRHPRPEVRSNAALALSRIVKPGTSKLVLLALIGTAEDEDGTTRQHSIAALGASRDHEAFSHLIRALQDPLALVRIRAAIALARLNDQNAAPYLIERLELATEKPDVKTTAARALASLFKEASVSTDPGFWKSVTAKKR